MQRSWSPLKLADARQLSQRASPWQRGKACAKNSKWSNGAMKREFVKLSILAALGGLLYMGVELLWRDRTHWTMGIVGGVSFVLIGGLNNYLPWEMPIWKQALCGSALVTAVELVAGIILNLYLGLGIWDYSGLPCNLLGQICLPFSLLWVAMSVLCIFVDDALRWRLFHEEKPHYRWL